MDKFLIIPGDKPTLSEDTNIYKRDYKNFHRDFMDGNKHWIWHKKKTPKFHLTDFTML